MNKFFISILLLGFGNTIFGQSILDFSVAESKKISIGIEDNNTGLIAFKPSEKIFTSLRQSFFTSELSTQILEADAGYRLFAKSGFNLFGRAAFLTDYRAETGQGWAGAEAEFSRQGLSAAYRANYIFFKNGGDSGNLFHQLGVVYFPENLGGMISFGKSPVFFQDENTVDLSVLFRQGRLTCKATGQFPTEAAKNFRILTSFQYSIGRLSPKN